MKLKVDDKGNAVLAEGKPVYVAEDGKEIEVDVPQLFGKITELNSENKKRREHAEGLEGRLKLFDGIEDLPKWKTEAEKAFETVKNLSDKELVDAKKVDEIKKEMRIAFEKEKENLTASMVDKEKGYVDQLKTKDATIYNLMVSSKFAQSPFFSGDKPKTLLPPEIAETYFGKHFKVEQVKGGQLRVVGYLSDNQIYSRKNPGELADFDEALETIVEAYPLKDRIMKASGGGSGASGGSGGGGGQGSPQDELAKLQKAHEEATKRGDAKSAITIKNRIFDLQRQMKK
jgi:hypothetical protein